MFSVKQGVTAPEFQKQGGKWEPDLHFTGSYGANAETEAIQTVIDAHLTGLVAYYLYSPLAGHYSLELQWDKTEEGRKTMQACRKRYQALFTPTGKLRKKFK